MVLFGTSGTGVPRTAFCMAGPATAFFYVWVVKKKSHGPGVFKHFFPRRPPLFAALLAQLFNNKNIKYDSNMTGCGETSVRTTASPAVFRPLKLLPHQRILQKCLPSIVFPLYLYWGMGSGKTIGACITMQTVKAGERIIVLCDKSIVGQWKRETARMMARNKEDYAQNIAVDVMHYEMLDKDMPNMSKCGMVVVDEAHRFRNAWERRSNRMLQWIQHIRRCPPSRVPEWYPNRP